MTRTIPIGEVCLSTIQNHSPRNSPNNCFTYIDISSIDKKAKAVTWARNMLGQDAPSRARRVIEAGDVIVSMTRPNLNTVALIDEKYHSAICSTGFCVLRPDRRRILPKYLFYIVTRDVFVERLSRNTSGGLYPAVSENDVRAMLIPLPPLKEQERIVEILDRAENIIRLSHLAMETTQRIASALFYEMFGNPIRNEKGWEAKRIGEICEQDRITYNNERDGQLTFLGLEHIKKNTGDIVELSEEGVSGKATTFVFDETHVLYGKLRPYLNKVVMPTFRGRCTTELIPYLPKPNIARCYLTYLLRSKTIVNTIVSNSTGTRMPRANLNFLERIKVGVPPYEMHGHKNFSEEKVASMNKFLNAMQDEHE